MNIENKNHEINTARQQFRRGGDDNPVWLCGQVTVHFWRISIDYIETQILQRISSVATHITVVLSLFAMKT